MESDDWLDTPPATCVPALPVPVELPAAPSARVALAEECWSRLSDKQRTFLTALRENRLNVRRTSRALYGTDDRRGAHNRWMHERDYMTVVRLWQGVAGSEALDRDRLLSRQDDIVETLMTPKPVLYQGAPTGIEEIEAGAASRANEVLMKAAGLLKDKELEVNVGIVVGPPTLNIQVMPKPPSQMVQRESVTIDAKFTEVPSDEWLGT